MGDHEQRNATPAVALCAICNEPCSQTATIPGHLDCWWDYLAAGLVELTAYLSNWAAFAAWEASATALRADAATEGGGQA